MIFSDCCTLAFLLSIKIQNRDFNFCNIVLDSADYQLIDPNLIGIAGEL